MFPTFRKYFVRSLFNSFLFRSSHPEVFCKKGVVRNFAKVTGKQLCQGLFLNKVACLRPEEILNGKLHFLCSGGDGVSHYEQGFLIALNMVK